MAKLNYEEEIFNAPIPGESMTVAPGRHPYDRPARTTSGTKAMELLLKSISKPKTMNKLLDAMDMGIPMDSISNVVLQSMFGEGIIPPQLIPILTPAVITMLNVTAEQAGIKPKMSSDFAEPEGREIFAEDIDFEEVEEEEAVETPAAPTQGLMTRPEEV